MGTVPWLRDAAVPGWCRRAGLALLACAAALTVLTAVDRVFGPAPSGDGAGWRDLLYLVPVGACGLCCLLRAVSGAAERTPWALTGTALLLFSLGTWFSTAAPGAAAAVPGWDLVVWLSWYAPVGVALVHLLRSRLHGVPRSLWLDSVVVGCAAAAAYADLLLRPYLSEALPEVIAAVGIGVAVGYPLGDLVLLMLVASVVVVQGWRLTRAWGWLVVALTGSAVLDGAQLSGLLSASAGTGSWPVFALMFAWAAGQPTEHSTAAGVTGRRMIVAPLISAVVVLLVLLRGAEDGFRLGVILATASYVALVARVVLLFDDVRRATAALQRANAEADRLARTDPLTGAANRRAFGEALGATGGDRAAGILLVDIDHFKQINDRYGHDAGDTVIVEVTRRMSTAVRHTDTVGRWGGEEFCVLLQDMPDLHRVEATGEKVRAAICGRPVDLPDGTAVDVTVSVGAVFLGHVTTLTFAMNAADEQLYAAKRGGRNQVRSADAGHGRAPG